MLQLKNLVKIYEMNGNRQTALKGINLSFRKNEFVAVLGQSGSGKTTLLNILGGLDRYTEGDMVIDGRSTESYTDRDWDLYRNSTIGFIFQSYNLIEHQSVLSNVELSLTLKGISKKERRRKAENALKRVGLEDHMHKRPNQLSGGQMQRVAIARALVNEPEILLADEPTGALDYATSVQIMDLLRDLAGEKLVIMVTHNPDLAEKYATRTIRIFDGQVIEDTDPYESETVHEKNEKKKYISMSPRTALMLSFNNLRTKKGRTVLTAFAGSIGIIGIALILSLSTGMQTYIDDIERDTMAAYPLSIQSETIDFSGSREAGIRQMKDAAEKKESSGDRIGQSSTAYDTLKSREMTTLSNNLKNFVEYLEEDDNPIMENLSSVEYEYNFQLNVYKEGKNTLQVNPSELIDSSELAETQKMAMESMGISDDIWTQILDDRKLMENQFELVAGKWPEDSGDLLLILDENGNVPDLALYTLGMKDAEEFREIQKAVRDGKDFDQSRYPEAEYTYDDFLGQEYKVLLPSEMYEKTGGIWADKSRDDEFIEKQLENATEVKITGIIRPTVDSTNLAVTGVIGYTTELRDQLMEKNNRSDIIKDQLADPDVNVFNGREFIDPDDYSDDELIAQLPYAQQMIMAQIPYDQKNAYMDSLRESLDTDYKDNLEKIGYIDRKSPESIRLFFRDFDSKDKVIEAIDEYNSRQDKDDVIEYIDIVGMMMDSVTTVINLITYLLIGFVSISLVVSSIMIGIITYISVLERTKEIGILRSIGASKKDVGQVFVAESAIIGLASGMIGILVTLVLDVAANIIISNLTGISGFVFLPPAAAVILVLISLGLTVISGLIPARIAAGKDPVAALRSE